MMEQRIFRSYQNGSGQGDDMVNEMLSKGWVVVCSNMVPHNDNLYGYVEYVLEKNPNLERGKDD